MPPRKVARSTLVSLAVVLVGVAFVASPALAAPKRRVVDGIVAVVDQACVTESELARFTAPRRAQLERELAKKPAERAAAMTALRSDGLQTLVERHLLEIEGRRLAVAIEPAEIDRALQSVAAQNSLDVAQLLVAVKEQGFDEAIYRAELRAQLLEAKLLQLDAPRRFSDWRELPVEARLERMARAREALLGELRARTFIEVRR